MSGNEINVQVPPTLDPVYSNMIQIAFKDDEFSMMFIHQLPGVNQAKAKALVAISPQHAKNFLQRLRKASKTMKANSARYLPRSIKTETISHFRDTRKTD